MRFLFLLCLAGVALCKAADYRPDRDGAETVVGLVVADPDGKPISDAEVMFRVFTTLDRCYKVIRETDGAGYCEISGKTRGEVSAVVSKSGYYTSQGELAYRDVPWEKSVETQKWTFGVVTNRMVLKPVLNPRRHICGGMLLERPPAVNEPLQFDVFQGDWCAPYGKGRVPDFEITCHERTNAVGRCLRGVTLAARHCVDGFVVRKADKWSAFKYALRADAQERYAHEVSIAGGEGKGGWSRDSYLVFRVRTATNQVGKIVKAHYGMIGESLDFQRGLTMNVHVNPENNDTSLEHDWAYRTMKNR